MAKGRRLSQEINAGSMADIAFLLLVFFLVTTTMDTEWGVQRRLPPPLEEEQDIELKKRNVFEVLANANDQLLVENEFLSIDELKEKAKEFITNPTNSEDLPEKTWVTASVANQKLAEYKQIIASDPTNQLAKEKYKKWQDLKAAQEVIGDFFDTKQVISLRNDRGTSYDLYIQVQNELTAAYNELRDKLAQEKFGKPFAELTPEQGEIVKTVYPQRISEAEPVDYTQQTQ